MANLNYWLTQSSLNHDYNPLITKDLDGFNGEQWYPYHESIVSVSLISALTTHFPVEANGREIQHIKTHSYFDDFYNRIHISPAALTLGNVASEQVSQVSVWNAYFTVKNLLDIENIQDDLTLSGQPDTPFSFEALQERSWDISIASNGTPIIDARLTWQFGTDQAVLHITGTRIVAFGWLVDWSKPVIENLSWLTDILSSVTGYEQRRSLRLAPRISYDVELLLTDQERQFFDLAMVGWSARIFAIPVWNQQQWLKSAHSANALVIYCDTTYRNFRPNRLAILRGENAFDNETVEIESVLNDRLIIKRPLQKNWSKGTCLSPAVIAQINSQPQLIKRTDRMMRTNVSLSVVEPVDHAEVLPALTYRNFPVLNLAPNEKNDLTHSYERLLQELDSGTGLSLRNDPVKSAFGLYQYAWMTFGRLEQHQLRELFYALRGSQKAIWLPTFSDDLTVVATILASGQSIDIAWIGYTRFAQKQLGRQDIQIILKNGSTLYRRITAATELNSTTERLAVDQYFNDQIHPSDIVRISFLSLCRLSNDTISIEHINDSDGVAKASVTFRGVKES